MIWVSALLAMGSGFAWPAPAGAAPAGATIYFYRSTAPADTYAVSPDGSGFGPVGCDGDRTQTGAPRRVLRVEAAGSETFSAYTDGSRWLTFPVVRLVSRDETCGDPIVLGDMPSGYRLGSPGWSVDGSRLAVPVLRYDQSGQLTDQGIWVGELGGGCGAALCSFHLAAPFPMVANVGQATGGPIAYYEYPVLLRWSGDARRVVYARAIDPAVSSKMGIFVADLGAPDAQTLLPDRQVVVTGASGSQSDPSFSPVRGDDRIAFTQITSTRGCVRSDIYVTTSAGGGASQVTTTRNASVCQLGRPEFSPDALWFTFDAWSGGLSAGQAIYSIRADGTAKAVLLASTSRVNYYAPHWRR